MHSTSELVRSANHEFQLTLSPDRRAQLVQRETF